WNRKAAFLYLNLVGVGALYLGQPPATGPARRAAGLNQTTREVPMEESVKQKLGSRKKIVALAIFLILLGFIVGIFTFLTVIGPILGLLLAVFGAMLLWQSGKARRTPM